MGRSLRRTVDMFYSARDLVEENDRRLESLEDHDDLPATEE